MAPIQNTFCIVPDAPSVLNANHNADTSNNPMVVPPMTTKQVKKAYQKANKGPKLSKAERRKQELFEQDRIRKEFEKERNQARARAARDKKKEKEERERNEKKKKGLPLVEVRPSQDTIARFVRPRSKVQMSKSQRDKSSLPPTVTTRDDDHCLDEQKWEHSYDDSNKENIPPCVQPGRTSTPPDLIGNNDTLGHASPIVSHVSHVSQVVEPSNQRLRVDDLEEGDHSQPKIVEEIATIPSSSSKATIPRDEPTKTSCLATGQKAGEPTVCDNRSTIDYIEDDFLEDFIRVVETISDNPPPSTGKIDPAKLRSPVRLSDSVSSAVDAVDNMRKTPQPTSPVSQQNQAPTPRSSRAPTSSVVGSQKSVPPSSRIFRHPRGAMAPPPSRSRPSQPVLVREPRTPQFLKPALPAHVRPIKPKPSQAQSQKSRLYSENCPPPSTQLFVLTHLDNFFPSPSQEVREIFDEPMRNIPQKAPAQSASVVQTKSTPASNAFEMPFFCTQDILLSSQDVKDIEEESLSQAKHHCVNPTPSKAWNRVVSNVSDPKPKPSKQDPPYSVRPSPKPLFTSTCREMRYKYALERNKTVAWEGVSARQKAREELDQLRVLEDQRLQELLVESDDEVEEANEKGDTGSMQSSGSEEHPPKIEQRTNKPADGPGPKAAATITKPRPKSSYETMLELLNKGPKKKSTDPFRSSSSSSSNNNNTDTLRNFKRGRITDVDERPQKVARRTEEQKRGGHVHVQAEAQAQMKTTVPASQETDYDWDDYDDVLRDML